MAVTKLIKDYEQREQMSDSGKSLIDGKGVDRIFSEIPRGLFYA